MQSVELDLEQTSLIHRESLAVFALIAQVASLYGSSRVGHAPELHLTVAAGKQIRLVS